MENIFRKYPVQIILLEPILDSDNLNYRISRTYTGALENPTIENVPPPEADILGGDPEDESLDEVPEDIDIFDIEEKSKPVYETIERDSDISESDQSIKSDVFIYPEDTVTEFREKIYTITGIPIYRQHIFIGWGYNEGKLERTLPIYYKIITDHQISVNITNTETSDFELGVPIDRELYNSKEYVHIEDKESLITLETIYRRMSINTYYVVDLENFIRPIRNVLQVDETKMELIYNGFVVKFWPIITYDIFKLYIKSTSEIKDNYPDLLPNVLKKQRTESEFINHKYDLLESGKLSQFNPEFAVLRTKSTKSVIDSDIKNITVLVGTQSDTQVNIRSLFDRLHVSKDIPFMRARLLRDYTPYTVSKIISGLSTVKISKDNPQYVFDKIKHSVNNIATNSMVMSIWPSDTHHIEVFFFENGKYAVQSSWEKEGVSFNDIIKEFKKHVNPIIEDINSLGRIIFTTPSRYQLIDESNIEFRDIHIELYWKKAMTRNNFDILVKAFKELFKTKMISPRIFIPGVNSPDSFEFDFKKAITEFDVRLIEKSSPLHNYYLRYSDARIKKRWESIFQVGRKVTIVHRNSDIKIDIEGVKQVEFKYLYHFIITVLHDFDKSHKTEKIVETFKDINALKKAKLLDPDLFSFKKYGSTLVYSRICQKLHQPMPYTEDEIRTLPKNIRDKAIKYWNFTTRSPLYYVCPNKKYPHLNFIIGQHPKGYCIPCCRKLPLEVGEVKKKSLYEACITNHVFDGDIVSDKSRYIMNYGKPIEIGRISNLPTSFSAFLMYNIQENIPTHSLKSSNLYIYGVAQNTGDIYNIGSLFSYSDMLNISPEKFIRKIVKEISDIHFSRLLRGTLKNYFYDINHFKRNLLSTFTVGKTTVYFDKWNELLTDIMAQIFNIYIIIFDDKTINTTGTNIKVIDTTEDMDIVLPVTTNYVKDIIPDPSDPMYSIRRYGLVIRKQKNMSINFRSTHHQYYPIYRIIPKEFFKNLRIEDKLYSCSDNIISVIKTLLENFVKLPNIRNTIDLRFIEDFVKSRPEYKIEKIFVNKQNLCYGVLVENSGYAYLPINYSYFSGHTVSYTPFYRKDYDLKYKTLDRLVIDINTYIIEDAYKNRNFVLDYDFNETKLAKMTPEQRYTELYNNTIPRFNYIVKTKALVLRSEKDSVIGFVSDNLYYYFNDIPYKGEGGISIYYDPDVINNIVYAPPAESSRDKRLDKIDESIYSHYLYQIVILEYVIYFDRERNNKIRKDILKLISNSNMRNIPEFRTKLKDIVKDYPEDFAKLREQINVFYNIHFDKKKLINSIDSSSYIFDKITLNNILSIAKGYPTGDREDVIGRIRNILLDISKEIIVFGVPKFSDKEYKNIIESCSHKNSYCERKKLIVPESRFYPILDVFIADLVNPVKRDILLAYSTMINNINPYMFHSVPGEEIYLKL